MTDWNYGNAYQRHPIEEGETAIFDNDSMLKAHNIFNPLPNIMLKADLLFIDPPWNLGNINSFYTKADRDDHLKDFELFYKRLFECIAEINPHTCYIEIGKEYLAEFIMELKKQFKYVKFYNSTYYHKKGSLCYVIRASNNYRRKKLPFDYMDEENIIEWVCENEEYNCIGDLCMGLGLVGLNAYKNSKKFVGTELNRKRLAVLIEEIVKTGGKYKIEGAETNG